MSAAAPSTSTMKASIALMASKEAHMRIPLALSTLALVGALATSSVFAQDATIPPGSMSGMQMPMQGQGGMSCCPCPMMQRTASVDNRLRQLEERAGISTSPAQPGAPAAPR
jgi:hypothetical protein